VIWGLSFGVKQGDVVALIGRKQCRQIFKPQNHIRLWPKKGEFLFVNQPVHKVEPFHLIEMGIALWKPGGFLRR
jgi:hypothetical protein